MIPARECTAAEYLTDGPGHASIPQLRIALRGEEYAQAARMWSTWDEPIKARDFARMAATLAYLAFPDLRQGPEQKEVAA
jgi:hypothetical protein